MPIRFSVMTYNVRSCIGTDRNASPARIAEVIAWHGADIICLQELDLGLRRSGKEDQASEIANRLNMDFHFHPSLRVEEGEYGNAVLSRYPSVVVKAGELPTLQGRTYLERRGALWVRIQIAERELNVITTHLGLRRRERVAQAEALLGPEWFGNPECRSPVVLCGDLNAMPHTGVYRSFSSSLIDACQIHACRGGGKTWPSRFPLLRIDHVFLSPDLVVEEVLVPRSKLTRTASDHLPVIVMLAMTS